MNEHSRSSLDQFKFNHNLSLHWFDFTAGLRSLTKEERSARVVAACQPEKGSPLDGLDEIFDPEP